MPQLLRTKKILLASPQPKMADLLVATLRGIGVTKVEKVADSHSAERALSLARFDAAILDFELRPKPVPELVVALRRTAGVNAHLPVVGLTSQVTEQQLREAMLSGVGKILRYPVSGDALRAALLSVLGPPTAPGGYAEI